MAERDELTEAIALLSAKFDAHVHLSLKMMAGQEAQAAALRVLVGMASPKVQARINSEFERVYADELQGSESAVHEEQLAMEIGFLRHAISVGSGDASD